ncbi:hypothetical protein [Frankia sp. AgW1.1]|uniref:hypothetical protein n=1 Tax=Frankia sp. AgW1.1 TaxID=1836971 RepID=UPI0019344364|nr:hypothetical protein [Frankia sp. AgW1.1]MBL7487111.1 hypothetical protein [Frankia sp. AgW1.1]
MSHWCESCNDRFDRPHWDMSTPLGEHLAGVEYGWVGRLVAIEAAAKELAAAVAPLLDGDTVVPYHSAWEIDTHHWADGEKLHERLAEAHGKLAGLLGDDG